MNFSIDTVMAVIETVLLLAALAFMVLAMREQKRTPAHRALQKKSLICVVAFVVLKIFFDYIL